MAPNMLSSIQSSALGGSDGMLCADPYARRLRIELNKSTPASSAT